MNTFVYFEYDRRLTASDRQAVISRGWGTTTEAKPTKATKVQVVEMTPDEFAAWQSAKQQMEATLWDAWKR